MICRVDSSVTRYKIPEMTYQNPMSSVRRLFQLLQSIHDSVVYLHLTIPLTFFYYSIRTTIRTGIKLQTYIPSMNICYVFRDKVYV